jgi:hypothetical protein
MSGLPETNAVSFTVYPYFPNPEPEGIFVCTYAGGLADCIS